MNSNWRFSNISRIRQSIVERHRTRGCQFSVYIDVNISDPQSSYPTYISVIGNCLARIADQRALKITITVWKKQKTCSNLEYIVYKFIIITTWWFLLFFTHVLYSFTNVINITKWNLQFTFFCFFLVSLHQSAIFEKLELAIAPLFPSTLSFKL